MTSLRKRDLVGSTSVVETANTIEMTIGLAYEGQQKTSNRVEGEGEEAITTPHEVIGTDNYLEHLFWDADRLSLTNSEKALPQLGTPLFPRQDSTSKLGITINNEGDTPKIIASSGTPFDRGWLNKWCYVKSKYHSQGEAGEPGLQVVWITHVESSTTLRYSSINENFRLEAGEAEIVYPYQRDAATFFLTGRQVVPAGPGRVHAMLTYTHLKVSPETVTTAREITTPFHYLGGTTRKHPMGTTFTKGGVTAAANVSVTPIVMDNHQTLPILYTDPGIAARDIRLYCGRVNSAPFLGYEPRRWLCMPSEIIPIGHSRRCYVIWRFSLSQPGETHDPIGQFTLPDGRTPEDAVLLEDWDGTQAGPAGNQWVSNGYRRSRSYLLADFNQLYDRVTREDGSHEQTGPYLGDTTRWEWRNEA